MIQFDSSPDNVDKLVAASLKEIERLKTEGPSADDVSKVKELERRDLETNAKQNSYWLGSMQTVHLYGWDPAGIARRSERTERLTQENIKAMFQKYFPTGSLHAGDVEAGVEPDASSQMRVARKTRVLLATGYWIPAT